MSLKEKAYIFMMFIGISIMCLFFATLNTGCMAIRNGPTVCKNVPEGQSSVICKLAKKAGVTPEEVSALVMIANMEAIQHDKYTAQEALKFIQNIEAFLDTSEVYGFTYAGIIQATRDKYEKLTFEIQLALMVYGDIPVPDIGLENQRLSPFDYKILRSGLSQQKEMILRLTE